MKLLLLAIFLWFNACSHIQTVGFNKEQNTVSVSGGKWAYPSEYEQEAQDYCQGPVKLMSMDTVNAGTQRLSRQTSMHIKRYVYTFSCLNGS